MDPDGQFNLVKRNYVRGARSCVPEGGSPSQEFLVDVGVFLTQLIAVFGRMVTRGQIRNLVQNVSKYSRRLDDIFARHRRLRPPRTQAERCGYGCSVRPADSKTLSELYPKEFSRLEGYFSKKTSYGYGDLPMRVQMLGALVVARPARCVYESKTFANQVRRNALNRVRTRVVRRAANQFLELGAEMRAYRGLDLSPSAIQESLVRFYGKQRMVHEPLTASGSRCGKARENVPTLPQTVAWTLMRAIRVQGSDSRGFLAWHSTGSGKTIVASGIMADHFYTDRAIVYMTSVNALKSNSVETFAGNMLRFNERFRRRITAEYRSKNGDASEDKLIEYVVGRMARRKAKFVFVSFEMFMNDLTERFKAREGLKEQLRDSVIVIDEVQNLLNPSKAEIVANTYVLAFLTGDWAPWHALRGKGSVTKGVGVTIHDPEYAELKVVPMSATPGATPEETAKILNIVRPPGAPLFDLRTVDDAALADLRVRARGLVSFFDGSGDRSKFPEARYLDEYTLPMSASQYRAYVEAMRKPECRAKTANSLANPNFCKGGRRAALATPGGSLPASAAALPAYSAKIQRLAELLDTHASEKHWAYSHFFIPQSPGVQRIGVVLERVKGYKRLTADEALQMMLDMKASKGQIPSSWKREPRYVLCTDSALQYSRGGGRRAASPLDAVRYVYNHRANVDGGYVRLMLASKTFNEGVDLRAVRHIHLLEPMLSLAAERQAVGRAVRNCSHSDYPETKNWTVTVHKYISALPPENVRRNAVKLGAARKAVRATGQGSKAHQQDLEKIQKYRAALEKNPANARAKQWLAAAEARVAKRNGATGKTEAVLNRVADGFSANATGESIDALVSKSSKERGSAMQKIMSVLRDVAVDCGLLSKYHASAGIPQNCSAAGGYRSSAGGASRAVVRSSPGVSAKVVYRSPFIP